MRPFNDVLTIAEAAEKRLNMTLSAITYYPAGSVWQVGFYNDTHHTYFLIDTEETIESYLNEAQENMRADADD